ncbi:DUF7546 family protein [Halorussus halobius]|uniref:DUF7546 family protein n=1 Tax=Halorussus halobius TaxID=1710537 RepID=UPI001B2FFB47|nr:hypothetical protein [Halorussus halobius]
MSPTPSFPSPRSASVPDARLERLARVGRTLVGLTAVEAVVVAASLGATGAEVVSWRYLVYPFVWINAAVLALAYAPIPRPTDRRTAGAAALAAGYFLVLCWVGGLVSAGGAAGIGTIEVFAATPGWGPILSVTGGAVHVSAVPFKLVGYVGLAALAYAALARTTRGAASALLGLATCVSCTGSVLATVLAGTLGGSSAAVVAATSQSYDLSTAMFVVAVATLWVALRR